MLFEDKNNDGRILEDPTNPPGNEVLQRELYYPFGLQLRGTAPLTPGVKQPYLNNGKELDDTGLYAYGFRYYDPATARFTGVDPLADQFAFVSGYNYAENRPISGIDLHGLQYFSTFSGAAQAEALFPERAKRVYQAARKYEFYSVMGTVAGIGRFLGAGLAAPHIGTITMQGVKKFGLNYAKRILTNLSMEAGESLVLGEKHDLSGIDYFDALNPVKGIGGNFMNATFNITEKGAGLNGLKDGIIEFVAGEAGSFVGRKLKSIGAELVEKSKSVDNYTTLYPVNSSTGRLNFALSVSRSVQQASDAQAGAGFLKRGENQGTLTGIVLENILKAF